LSLRTDPVTDQLELEYRKAMFCIVRMNTFLFRALAKCPTYTLDAKANTKIKPLNFARSSQAGFLNLLPGPTHPDLRASAMEIGDMQLAAVISDNFSTQR
jgi:hypothetical protein